MAGGIETTVQGAPDAIADAGRWLGETLSTAAGDGADLMHQARSRAAAGWSGAASSAFQSTVTEFAARGDDLAQAAQISGQGFADCAEHLQEAQELMRQALAVAGDGGLTVDGSVIQPPGPEPAAPPTMPQDADNATRESVGAAIGQAVQAQREYARKVAAYVKASGLAGRARALESDAMSAIGQLGDYFRDHPRYHGLLGGTLTALGDLTTATSIGLSTQLRPEDYVNPGDPASGLKPFSQLSKAGKWLRGLEKGNLALSVAQPFADVLRGKDPSKDIADGATGLALGALAGTAGLETGGTALLALGLYETYKHPVGAGIVANAAVSGPTRLKEHAFDSAADAVGAHSKPLGDLLHTQTDLNPGTLGAKLSGDTARFSVSAFGHFAQGSSDALGDSLHNTGKTLGDLAGGHPLDALDDYAQNTIDINNDVNAMTGAIAHDASDAAHRVADDASDTANGLADDAQNLGNDASDAAGTVGGIASDVMPDVPDIPDVSDAVPDIPDVVPDVPSIPDFL